MTKPASVTKAWSCSAVSRILPPPGFTWSAEVTFQLAGGRATACDGRAKVVAWIYAS
jgi:hypothetical protein